MVATAADELILAGPGIDAVYYSGVRPGNGGVTIDLRVVGSQETGDDTIIGRGGYDRCSGSAGTDTIRSCEEIGDRR